VKKCAYSRYRRYPYSRERAPKALAAARASAAYKQIFQDTNGGKTKAYPYLPEAEEAPAPAAAKVPKAIASVREALLKKGGSMSLREMRSVPACAKLLEKAGCNAETSPSTADALLTAFFKAQSNFFRANGDVVALKAI